MTKANEPKQYIQLAKLIEQLLPQLLICSYFIFSDSVYKVYNIVMNLPRSAVRSLFLEILIDGDRTTSLDRPLTINIS